MKIHKVGLNLKIASSKIKDISSSKVVPSDQTELSTSKSIKGLQVKTDINQINTETGIKINSPRINLLNSVYSRQEIQGKKIDNLRKSTLRELSTPDKDRIVSSTPDVRQEKIIEVKKKLAQGYYSRIEVYSKVADKILDILI
jgi:hypothetical protein